jgi:hypothetical protein
MRMTPKKTRWKLKKEMFVNLDLFWTPLPDENSKRGGVSAHEFQKIKKNPNHDSRKLKFAIFENFTNHGESIRDIHRGSRE